MTQNTSCEQLKNKVTVITVSYNAKSLIEKTILSVIQQSYVNIEYIIIDGNSSDGTTDIIKKYETNIQSWMSEPDKGIFNAMNKGLELATGDWVIFMNAGDCFVNKNVVESIFEQKYEDSIGVVYGKVYLDTITKNRLSNWMPFIKSRSKVKGMGISHQAIFTKTKLAKRIRFNESFKIAADYDMINQIYNEGYSFYDTMIPIAVYDTFGYSAKNRVESLKEVARICNADKTINFAIKLSYLKFKLFVKKLLN